MDSLWFKGLSPDEIEERKNFLRSNKKVLDILSEIVYNIRIGTERTSITDYDCPSWSHKQAHENGVAEAYRRIERMLSLDPQG